jgi:hypothetical protein
VGLVAALAAVELCSKRNQGTQTPPTVWVPATVLSQQGGHTAAPKGRPEWKLLGWQGENLYL